MKKLSVVVAGTGQIRDVEIQPGTTAGDILHQLNLPDYLLSKGPNEPFFAAAESVYDKVKDGEKIFASTKAEVGIARMRVKDLGTRPAPASIREMFSRVVRGHGPRYFRPAPPDPVLAGTRLDPRRKHLHRHLSNALRGVSRLDRRGTVRPHQLSIFTTRRRKSGATAIGPAFRIAATTGIWSTWRGDPRTSARESSPSND